MSYQAAIGFNNTNELANLAQQPLDLNDPRTPSVQPARIQTTLDAHRVADGYRLAALVYDDYLTPDRLRAVLVQVGLRNESSGVESESAEITIYLPGQDREWETWNAVIYHPHPEFQRGRFGTTTFDLVLKERLA